MSSDIEKLLKGSRQDIKNAAEHIETQFKELRKGSSKDAVYRALRLELLVMRQICLLLQEQKHANADIYCDIMTTMLPVEPQEGQARLWKAHLDSVRFIHHHFAHQNLKESQRFYTLINQEECRLQSETDYTIFLGIHLTHFEYLQKSAKVAPSPASTMEEIHSCVQNVGHLFDVMLKEKHLNYNNLIVQLNELLLIKRSSSFHKSLATLPPPVLEKMVNPMLKLLANLQQCPPDFSEYLGAFLALLQIDLHSPKQLEQQFGLQLLRISRDLFKTQSTQTYAIELLYYYVKLLYLKEPLANFHSVYIDICKKFVCFLDRKITADQAKEQWFMDFIITMQRVQMHLNQLDSKKPSFPTFWQHFKEDESADSYAGHFLLLQTCVRLAVNVQRSPLAGTCNSEGCKSVRRHCIISLVNSALCSCATWEPKEADRKNKSYHKPLVENLIYGMEIAKDMKCMGPDSPDLIRFVRFLAFLISKVACTEQWCLIQPLLEPLKPLLSLTGAEYLHYLLRRLAKASSAYCPRPELAICLQATYIANQTNALTMRSLMCLQYQSAKSGPIVDKCLYEWYKSNPIAHLTRLTEAQLEQFYDMNLSLILLLFSTPPSSLAQSLIRCRRTDYHWILIARHMRSDKDMLVQCQELCNKSRRATLTGQKLSRMENLCAGHASAHLLLDALEAQKIKASIRDIKEIELAAFFIKNNLMDFNIQRESRLVELSVNVIEYFGAFFRRADAEPLESNETAIDWEALIDDGITAAVSLSSMGYTTQADNAWFLLLEIGKLLDDRFTYLRALTYFLSLNRHSHVFRQLQIAEELEKSQEMLDDLWPQVTQRFYKRHHTIVMLCLCHMAYYYAKIDCKCHAQLLIMLVEDLREEFPERQDKNDIVLITLQTVKFRIVKHQKQCEIIPKMSPLRLLDTVQDSVCKFTHLSSVDMGALHLLLGDLVKEGTECTSNRLTERFSFSNIMLNVSIQNGLAFRAVEVLTSWLWTNLQMEDLDRAQVKLNLIEHILGIKSLSKDLDQPVEKEIQKSNLKKIADEYIKSQAGSMPKNHIIPMMQQVEPIRKQVSLEIEDTPHHHHLLKETLPPSKYQLQCYLSRSDKLLIQDSEQLQYIYFTIGCLHARLLFLKRENYEQLDYFYEQASIWLKEQQSKQQQSLHNLPLMLHMQNMNYLRKRNKIQLAIAYGNEALKLTSDQPQHYLIDLNYSHNLFSQLMGAYSELRPPSPLPVAKTKKVSLRRALTFNISPEEKLKSLNTLNPKTPKFTIYSEQKQSLPSPEGEDDLDTCQIIEIADTSDEENAVPLKPTKSAPLSARKGRLPTRTPIKPQRMEDKTPAKTETKPTRSRSAKPQEDSNEKLSARNTRSRSAKPSIEISEKPPSTRSRRRVMGEQGQQLEPISSRRRNRDL
ncbi:uncharacterized protein Dwil_GK22071 [Drosophila willistoni]|uniref:Protein three rows n=1 Tax=Drosophila willistoni TaxID=7260 RepID=B4MYJ3_DROWI|nr:protein three rows [Drosophila willistoni]EDW77182.1 uncharacterized protein Dwil_GK22071 [Drosophila willistoni]